MAHSCDPVTMVRKREGGGVSPDRKVVQYAPVYRKGGCRVYSQGMKIIPYMLTEIP